MQIQEKDAFIRGGLRLAKPLLKSTGRRLGSLFSRRAGGLLGRRAGGLLGRRAGGAVGRGIKQTAKHVPPAAPPAVPPAAPPAPQASAFPGSRAFGHITRGQVTQPGQGSKFLRAPPIDWGQVGRYTTAGLAGGASLPFLVDPLVAAGQNWRAPGQPLRGFLPPGWSPLTSILRALHSRMEPEVYKQSSANCFPRKTISDPLAEGFFAKCAELRLDAARVDAMIEKVADLNPDLHARLKELWLEGNNSQGTQASSYAKLAAELQNRGLAKQGGFWDSLGRLGARAGKALLPKGLGMLKKPLSSAAREGVEEVPKLLKPRLLEPVARSQGPQAISRMATKPFSSAAREGAEEVPKLLQRVVPRVPSGTPANQMTQFMRMAAEAERAGKPISRMTIRQPGQAADPLLKRLTGLWGKATGGPGAKRYPFVQGAAGYGGGALADPVVEHYTGVDPHLREVFGSLGLMSGRGPAANMLRQGAGNYLLGDWVIDPAARKLTGIDPYYRAWGALGGAASRSRRLAGLGKQVLQKIPGMATLASRRGLTPQQLSTRAVRQARSFFQPRLLPESISGRPTTTAQKLMQAGIYGPAALAGVKGVAEQGAVQGVESAGRELTGQIEEQLNDPTLQKVVGIANDPEKQREFAREFRENVPEADAAITALSDPNVQKAIAFSQNPLGALDGFMENIIHGFSDWSPLAKIAVLLGAGGMLGGLLTGNKTLGLGGMGMAAIPILMALMGAMGGKKQQQPAAAGQQTQQPPASTTQQPQPQQGGWVMPWSPEAAAHPQQIAPGQNELSRVQKPTEELIN